MYQLVITKIQTIGNDIFKHVRKKGFSSLDICKMPKLQNEKNFQTIFFSLDYIPLTLSEWRKISRKDLEP